MNILHHYITTNTLQFLALTASKFLKRGVNASVLLYITEETYGEACYLFGECRNKLHSRVSLLWPVEVSVC